MYDKTEVVNGQINDLTKALYKVATANGVQMVITTLVKVTEGEELQTDKLSVTVSRGEGEPCTPLALITAIAKGALDPEHVYEGLKMLHAYESFKDLMLASAPPAGNA